MGGQRREPGATGQGQPLREITAGYGGGDHADLGRPGAGGGIGHAGDAEPGQPSPDGCQIGCRRRRKALAQPAVQPEQPAVGTSIRAASCSGRCGGMIVEADRGDGGGVEHPQCPGAVLHPHGDVRDHRVEIGSGQRAGNAVVIADAADPATGLDRCCGCGCGCGCGRAQGRGQFLAVAHGGRTAAHRAVGRSHREQMDVMVVQAR